MRPFSSRISEDNPGNATRFFAVAVRARLIFQPEAPDGVHNLDPKLRLSYFSLLHESDASTSYGAMRDIYLLCI